MLCDMKNRRKRLTSKYADRVRPIQITKNQGMILLFLSKASPENCYAKMIEMVLEMPQGSGSITLSRLIDKGYVKYIPRPPNFSTDIPHFKYAPSTWYALTEEGHDVLNRISI